jgi:hypothetical protein
MVAMSSKPRGIREQARDRASAAAVSLLGSVAATALFWLVLRWLI